MGRSLTKGGKASTKFLSKKWKSSLNSHRHLDCTDKKYLEEFRKLQELACHWEAGLSNDVSKSPTQTHGKSNYASRLLRTFAESSNNTQTVSSKKPVPLPLVSSTGVSSVSAISNYRSDSLTRTSDDDSSSLPIVSSTVHDSSTNSAISRDSPSVLPIVSTAAANTSPVQNILRNHCSVGTQVNFDPYSRNKPAKLQTVPDRYQIRGRRLVNFRYMLTALRNLNNHSAVGCNLNNMIITNEKRSGLFTSYVLKCVVCNFEKEIHSELPYAKKRINTDFVSAMLDIKCNFQDADVLLEKMNLPLISHADFLDECKKISNADIDIKNSNETISTNMEENVQQENQLNVMEQYSPAEESSQKGSRLIARPRYITAEKNEQKRSQISSMKKCSSATVGVQKASQLSTMQQRSSIAKNTQKEFQLSTMQQRSSIAKNAQKKSQLSTVQQRSSIAKNAQKGSQLSTMQQRSSMAENAQKESQLSTMQQRSSLAKNAQKASQLSTRQQRSSMAENAQKESQLCTMQQHSSIAENLQKASQLSTLQKRTSASDNSSLFDQAGFDRLLIKDQFEIEEERDSENENEFETSIPDKDMRAFHNKLIVGREEVVLNTTIIKQEITSDGEDSTASINYETTNSTKNEEQTFFRSVTPLQNEARTCENEKLVNQKQVSLQKNIVVENKEDMLVKPQFKDVEITDKGNTPSNNVTKPESELPLKKARMMTCKDFNVPGNAQLIKKINPNREIKVFKLVPKSNKNSVLIAPQKSSNKESGTSKGVSRTKLIPIVKRASQRLSVAPNSTEVTHVPSTSAVQLPSNTKPRIKDYSVRSALSTSVRSQPYSVPNKPVQDCTGSTCNINDSFQCKRIENNNSEFKQ